MTGTHRFAAWTAALAASGAAAPALAQTLGHGADVQVSYWRVAAALVLCLVLAAAAALALRARFASGRPLALADLLRPALGVRGPGAQRSLTVLERLRINPQLEVCLLACEGRRYLIAATPSGAVLLDKDLPPAPSDAGAPS